MKKWYTCNQTRCVSLCSPILIWLHTPYIVNKEEKFMAWQKNIMAMPALYFILFYLFSLGYRGSH